MAFEAQMKQWHEWAAQNGFTEEMLTRSDAKVRALLADSAQAGKCVYLLLADGDGTMRSIDEPWAAVLTEEEAKRYVAECEAKGAKKRMGYSHSLRKIRVFDTWEDAAKARQTKQG